MPIPLGEGRTEPENRDTSQKDSKREFKDLDEAVLAIREEVIAWEGANRDKRTLILVAAPTAAGKGTFVDQMAFSPADTTVLSLDRYYFGKAELEARDGKANFSTPSALDTERIRRDVHAFLIAKDGEHVKVPVFSMKESKRVGEEEIPVTRRLVIEGIYAIDQVDAETPFKIYIDVTEDTMLRRKLARDTTERGIPEEVVKERFEQNVRPATRQYVVPQRDKASIVINNDKEKKA